MGIDDNTPTKHENIQSEGTIYFRPDNPTFNNIYFHGADGPGISKQKATQEIAAMLVKEYQKLTGVDII